MSQIVLATLNARYTHTSFGLRYLMANMGPLREQTCLLEFVINDNMIDVLATILDQDPKIVGLGVYIWNVEPMTRLVANLKRIRPDIMVILGGPEVSYEFEEQPIVQLADHVITGEADLAFQELCGKLLTGEACVDKIVQAPIPQFAQLNLPYDLYCPDDVANRVIYVEVSRGCPFTCEFCLSSLEIPVRLADVDCFLGEMQKLLDRGAKQFKFVDRTFNLNLRVSRTILEFFLDRLVPGLFLHFEMIPDRLPEALRELISKFPAGTLQFEIGVQTFNDDVGVLISRRQDNTKLEDNFRYLRAHTGVHVHADLIVGLPGESLESFATGFDRLYALRPQEIQIGILKRLRGTPIVRHDETWQMQYSPNPPYEILCNRLLTFHDLQCLRRFARYWDLIGNSGNFVSTLAWIIRDGESAFRQFGNLRAWLFCHNPKMHGISLSQLFESVFEYLTQPAEIEESPSQPFSSQEAFQQSLAESMWNDYTRIGRRDRPSFLKGFKLERIDCTQPALLPARQLRHLRPTTTGTRSTLEREARRHE